MGDRDDSTGLRFRAIRERLGVGQSQAARLAGMYPQHVYAYERGKAATLDVWHRLATAIGADPHELDPRLCPSADTRALTLVFSGADPERPALAGETDADDRLITELLPAGCRLGVVNDPALGPRVVSYVGRRDVGRLIQAAGEARVKLIVRTDLAPRVVPAPGAEAPAPAQPRKRGGRPKRA